MKRHKRHPCKKRHAPFHFTPTLFGAMYDDGLYVKHTVYHGFIVFDRRVGADECHGCLALWRNNDKGRPMTGDTVYPNAFNAWDNY